MPGDTVDFDVAHAIGAKLPGVAGSVGGRGMALRIKGRILACQAINNSAEPNSLMVRIGSERRDALLAQNPDAYYLTKHYQPYPVILVRLDKISRTYLGSLLAEAWDFVQNELK
jgi:hypothetical protein